MSKFQRIVILHDILRIFFLTIVWQYNCHLDSSPVDGCIPPLVLIKGIAANHIIYRSIVVGVDAAVNL